MAMSECVEFGRARRFEAMGRKLFRFGFARLRFGRTTWRFTITPTSHNSGSRNGRFRGRVPLVALKVPRYLLGPAWQPLVAGCREHPRCVWPWRGRWTMNGTEALAYQSCRGIGVQDSRGGMMTDDWLVKLKAINRTLECEWPLGRHKGDLVGQKQVSRFE